SAAEERQYEMCQRRQITARSNRSFRWDDRNHSGIEHLAKEFHGLKPDPRVPFRECIEPENRHRTNHFVGDRLPGPGRVTRDEIRLKIFKIFGTDDNVAQLAE